MTASERGRNEPQKMGIKALIPNKHQHGRDTRHRTIHEGGNQVGLSRNKSGRFQMSKTSQKQEKEGGSRAVDIGCVGWEQGSTSEAQPVVTSETQPVVTSDTQPVVTSEAQPVVTSEAQLVVTNETQPVVTTEA